jgi:hypothetical protein
MPVQMSFGDLAVRAEKLPEWTFLTLCWPLESAMLIFRIWALFLVLRVLDKDSLSRVHRGGIGGG